MKTGQIGNIGVGRAIRYFTSLGRIVSIPLSDNQDYDLVVEGDDGSLLRIQVKYTSVLYRKGVHALDLRVKYRRYSLRVQKTFEGKKRRVKPGDDVKFDFVFCAAADGTDWLIPRDAIVSRMHLNPDGKAGRYIVVASPEVSEPPP